MSNATASIDYNEMGRAGVTILVAKHIKIIECGCKGDGSLCWVTIETRNRPLSVGSVYGFSKDPKRRRDLWKWMEVDGSKSTQGNLDSNR